MKKVLIAESGFGRHHQANGFEVISTNGNDVLDVGKKGIKIRESFVKEVLTKAKNADYIFVGTDADYMGQVVAEYLKRGLQVKGYSGRIVRMPLTYRGYLLSDFSGEWIIDEYERNFHRGRAFKWRYNIKEKTALILADTYKKLQGKKLLVENKNPNGSNTLTAMVKAKRLGLSGPAYLKSLYFQGVIAYPRVEMDYKPIEEFDGYVAHPSFFDDIDFSPLSKEQRKVALQVLTPIDEPFYVASSYEDILLSAYNSGIITPSTAMKFIEDRELEEYIDISKSGDVEIKVPTNLIHTFIDYYEKIVPTLKSEEREPVPVIKLPLLPEDDYEFSSFLEYYLKKLDEEKKKLRYLRNKVVRGEETVEFGSVVKGVVKEVEYDEHVEKSR